MTLQLLLIFASLLHSSAIPANVTPRQLLAEGRVDDAVRVLQQQVSLHPADAESFNLLCRAYFMADDWDPALEACQRAASLAPQSSMYQLWLGRVYGEKADHSSI